jgi:hypothetical protein
MTAEQFWHFLRAEYALIDACAKAMEAYATSDGTEQLRQQQRMKGIAV